MTNVLIALGLIADLTKAIMSATASKRDISQEELSALFQARLAANSDWALALAGVRRENTNE